MSRRSSCLTSSFMTTPETSLVLFKYVLFHLPLRCSNMVVLFSVSFRYAARQSLKNCFRIVGDPKHETVTTSSVRMPSFSSTERNQNGWLL